MVARHVSDLTGPSSGAFYKLYLQIWYVVIRELIDTSSRYEVVGRTFIKKLCVSCWTAYILQLHHSLTKEELFVPMLEQTEQTVSLQVSHMYFLAANSMVQNTNGPSEQHSILVPVEKEITIISQNHSENIQATYKEGTSSSKYR